MVRVCLISATTANDFQDPQLAEMDAIRVIAEHAPLGILSLGAVLERCGITPVIVDLNRLYYDCLRSDEYGRGEIDFCAYAARYFESRDFDLYGFSTICSSYPLTLRIAMVATLVATPLGKHDHTFVLRIGVHEAVEDG